MDQVLCWRYKDEDSTHRPGSSGGTGNGHPSAGKTSGPILVGTRNHTAQSGSNYSARKGRRVREAPQMMPELDNEGGTGV